LHAPLGPDKHVLRRQERAGWSDLMAAGPQDSGKTLIAEILCEVLGVDPDLTILIVDAETTAGLFGWSTREPGRYRSSGRRCWITHWWSWTSSTNRGGLSKRPPSNCSGPRTSVSRGGERVNIAPAVVVLRNKASRRGAQGRVPEPPRVFQHRGGGPGGRPGLATTDSHT
jgi:hypothetical protein